MDDTGWIQALEQANLERIELMESRSGEAELGRKINSLKSALPFHLLSWYRARKRYFTAKRKSEAISHPVKPEERTYFSAPPVSGKKGVVYACVTHGYDTPYAPLFRDPGLDYVLYTDKEGEEGPSVWTRRPLKEELRFPNAGNRANRYYKFHPFECFPGYDYAIYTDGNVRIMSDVTALYRCAENSPAGIAMHRHAQRSCVYEEAQWCAFNGRGNQEAIARQMKRYHEEGLPKNFGLFEATIIVIDLLNPKAKEILDAWWEEFCQTGSGRDQLSFPYALWKKHYSADSIGCLGNDEYHNPKFLIFPHASKTY